MKRAVTTLAALLWVGTLAAQPAGSYPPGAQAAPEPLPPARLAPDQLLRRGLDRLSGFLRGARGAAQPGEIRAFLDDEIAPYFDFPAMARWSAGPLYPRLTPQQRTQLTARLRDLFLGALARNLGAYAQPVPRMEVYPARMSPWMGEANVRALVLPHDGYPIQLDFRFYRTRYGWKVFDVAANGASAAAFYRSYFGDLLRRYGPGALG
jgi:phospholipid transport system substrate-binding protein